MNIVKSWRISPRKIGFFLSSDLAEIPNIRMISTSKLPSYSVGRMDKLDFAKECSYCIDKDEILFLLTSQAFPSLNGFLEKNYYVCGDFNDWGSAIGKSEWKLCKRSDSLMLNVDLSKLVNSKNEVFFKFASDDGVWLEPSYNLTNLHYDSDGNRNLRIDFSRTGLNAFVVEFVEDFSICGDIVLELSDFGISQKVDEGELLDKLESSAYLGVRKLGDSTEFSIFAPRAKSASVEWWFGTDSSSRKIAEAFSKDGMVWTALVDRNLNGARYFWRIDTSASIYPPHIAIPDPYANAMLSSNGASVVKFEEDLPISDNTFNPPSWNELVILETHIRDLLARADFTLTSKERLSFKGLEKWLSSESCYLKQTGVNCVELQPIQEFTANNHTDYEWGYMPVNWFAPASSYALNPDETSQNRDFADLIKAFHNAGIAVILDVVYNHFGEPNHLAKIDADYYFEKSDSGGFSNFSGCGNDFKASAPMARRMIIDSLKRLVVNYGVDGFRFDLAELLGIEVLEEIEREMKKIKPSIILIAEPWSFRGHIAGALSKTGFSYWNDGFREFMLRYAKGEGNFEGFKYYIGGSQKHYANWTAQTVNYLESHDDMCLFDRIASSWQNPTLEDIGRYKLAYALVLTSLGIPMLAEGFDLLRTKFGKNNTYKDGLTNELDYSRAETYSGLTSWLRELVKFRTSSLADALKVKDVEDSYMEFYKVKDSSAVAVMFNADSSIKAKKVFVAFNPSDIFVEVNLKGIDLLRDFKLIADSQRADINGLKNPLPKIENGKLRVCGLGISIWVEK